MAEDEEVCKKVIFLNNKILMLENNIKKMRFTITTAGDIGKLIINIAEINQQFLYDFLNSNSKIQFDDLIISNEFYQPCEKETEDYFKDPLIKIDVAVLDGSHSLWPHIITYLELKIDLSRDDAYHEVLRQLNERFSGIFDQ
ncbi:16299_t:CDS:2 [Funneliformis geosporum]|uniref:16299_t:CDS:1 n=1 Tax=Funneliformis geosporum TaxID=1117311 RepID=A0A9W4T1T1_9GLOM|nr:16299_t:CDS:2 [Funneliformis geosporum]